MCNIEPECSKMNYSEFSIYIDENGIDPIMYYDGTDGWEVYLINGKYYYYGCPEEDSCDDYFEIKPIAQLAFTEKHDLKIKEGTTLANMFDCICCGEISGKDHLEYVWFVPANPDDFNKYM